MTTIVELSKLTFEQRCKETDYCIEANDFEQHTLWAEYSTESQTNTAENSVTWSDPINPGYTVTIGDINNRPIVVSLSWAKIEDRIVCFYYACSELVDHKMVNIWLMKTFGTPRSDARNFHNCLFELKRLNNSPKCPYCKSDFWRKEAQWTWYGCGTMISSIAGQMSHQSPFCKKAEQG